MLINLKLKTHSDLLDERSRLVEESVELMRRQGRSNHKYAQKMNRILNKLIKLEQEMYKQ